MSSIQGPNTDFASELYINKLVNGQVASKNGRTISSGSRDFSATLHTEANDLNHISTGLENGQVYALSRQNVMEEVKHVLEDMKKILGDFLESSGGDNPPDNTGQDNALADVMKSMTANMASLLNSKDFDGVGLFEDKGKTFDAGMGMDITVGDTAMDSLENAFGANFNTAITAMDIDYKALYDMMDGAIDTAQAEINAMGSEYSMLDTRAQAIDDMGITLRDTADTSTVIVTKA